MHPCSIAAALSILATVGCGAGTAQAPADGNASSATSEAQPVAAVETSGESFEGLFQQGVTFDVFLDEADRRRDTWHGNYERARVPDALLARAQAIPGQWRVLVMAEDWCGDSANTIPYLARLLEQLDQVEMRVVNSEVGAAIGEAHQTPDGRSATPTVVVLDERGNDVGCWVERPTALQEWFLAESTENGADDALYDRKYAWYDWDVGQSTMAEVTDVLAGAAAGTPVCR